MDGRGTLVGPIVVGADGSDTSHAAIRWAAQLAHSRRAPLRVVHVWPPPTTSWPWPLSGMYVDPSPYATAARHLVDEAADRIRDELGDHAPLIDARCPEGSPVTGLLAAAADADLLVVGSRGRGGFASLILGSVALGCAHHSPLPVAVVAHEGADAEAGPIVVGIDGSHAARTALRWAGREAARRGQTLLVVHAWDEPDVAPPGDLAFGPRAEEFERQGKELLDETVHEALDGITPPPTVETRLVPDAPARALLAASEGAGLLVVGSRGRGTLSGLVLGSVSQQCLHHAPVPVVVVPAAAEALPPAPPG